MTPPCGTPLFPLALSMIFSKCITSASSTRCATFARRRSCRTLSNLVGAGKQRRWDREAERLRGSCVDYQLELEALLDREVSRLGVLENPSGVGPACRYKSTNSLFR